MIALVSVGLAALACVGALATAGAAGSDRTQVYRGNVNGDSSAKVTLRIDGATERRRAVLTIKRLLIHCEDGRTHRETFEIATRFSGTRFHHEYPDDQAVIDDILTYSEFGGRLRGTDRANGFFIHVDDYQNPPSGSAPPHPDCGTEGKVEWKASVE